MLATTSRFRAVMQVMPLSDFSKSPFSLAGKKALVVGVANDQSIAWGCAKVNGRAHLFELDLRASIIVDDHVKSSRADN